MTDSHDRIVKDYWSKVDISASDKNFYCFPAIRSRSCRLILGESDAGRRDWCQYWTVEKYLKKYLPVEKCLSICCGFGEIERMLARLNVARQIIGVDIAPGAIEKARERAAAEGLGNIDYRVADLNVDSLPAEEYDVIWANGALHHIRELNLVAEKLKRALKPGGFLVSNEYVGPDYQQLPVRQQEIINAVRHLLPQDLRSPSGPTVAGGMLARLRGLVCRALCSRPSSDEAIYSRRWEMPGVEQFLATDPSECVRSSEIIPTLQRNFNDIDVRYFNGSVLFYALEQAFYDNFDHNNIHHRRILELLFAIEDHFIETGEIQRDNAHIICRKEATS